MNCANDYEHCKSANVVLYGSAGSGKSEFVHEIANIAGFSKIYQVNGREDMDSSDFLGDKTIVIDKESGQNKIEWNKGPLYRAFIEGTEVDEKGNQILYNEYGEVVTDGSGKPKVIGKPGLFFLDEFAAINPSVFLAVFNRAMEIPREAGCSRSIEISGDGGRIVKSHPGFAMFLAGNTVGRGTDNEGEMGYTAQNNIMDDSTLNRITATYHFGFNLEAEKEIMTKKFKDEEIVNKMIRFRDEIRKQWVESKIETLFSTRSIVSVCDLAMMFEKMKIKDFVPLAIFRSVFSSLKDREKAGWNETIRNVFSFDVMNFYNKKEKNMWFGNK